MHWPGERVEVRANKDAKTRQKKKKKNRPRHHQQKKTNEGKERGEKGVDPPWRVLSLTLNPVPSQYPRSVKGFLRENEQPLLKGIRHPQSSYGREEKKVQKLIKCETPGTGHRAKRVVVKKKRQGEKYKNVSRKKGREWTGRFRKSGFGVKTKEKVMGKKELKKK